jgi:hypothetical protein
MLSISHRVISLSPFQYVQFRPLHHTQFLCQFSHHTPILLTISARHSYVPFRSQIVVTVHLSNLVHSTANNGRFNASCLRAWSYISTSVQRLSESLTTIQLTFVALIRLVRRVRRFDLRGMARLAVVWAVVGVCLGMAARVLNELRPAHVCGCCEVAEICDLVAQACVWKCCGSLCGWEVDIVANFDLLVIMAMKSHMYHPYIAHAAHEE